VIHSCLCLVEKYCNMDSYGFHDKHSEVAPKPSCGTTILAAEYDGGVMIAADSRTSMGSVVSNRQSNKLTPVTPYIYCCRSGSAADTQAITDMVKYHLNYYEMEHGERATVSVAANIFRDYCYRYRDQLSAGILVAGWDKEKGGQIFGIPIGGMIVKMPLASGGSGSTYIIGHMDNQFKQKMSRAECEEFLKKSVALAISRDGSSGGVIRIATINEKGLDNMKCFTGDDIPSVSDMMA